MTKTIADRPLYKGLPVPWVTRWDAEICGEPYATAIDHEGQIITYDKETPFDRDERGVLWMREFPLNNGKGKPEFATFSSYRQRACMQENICQVCGGPDATWWIMTDLQLQLFNHYKGVTENPPVCEACIREAERWCPHIKNSPHEIWRVSESKPVGYVGEIAMYLKDKSLYRKILPLPFDADSKLLRCLLARQLSVQIEEYEVIRNV